MNIDDIRRARAYITQPTLCTVEGAVEWVGALASEVEALRKRVAELEAERPHMFREEFGVEWADDPNVEICNSFEHARPRSADAW
jgi:hypothetical protein